MVIGINLLGLIAFVIGLFVTLPATMIAYTFVYRKLLERKDKRRSGSGGNRSPVSRTLAPLSWFLLGIQFLAQHYRYRPENRCVSGSRCPRK